MLSFKKILQNAPKKPYRISGTVKELVSVEKEASGSSEALGSCSGSIGYDPRLQAGGFVHLGLNLKL